MSWPRARWKYDAEAVPYLPEREPGRKRAVAAEETGGSMESVHSGHDGRACDEMHATRCRGGEWEGCAGQQSKTAVKDSRATADWGRGVGTRGSGTRVSLQLQ